LLRVTPSLHGEALDFATRFKASAAVAPAFLASWARAVADLESAEGTRALLEDPWFRVEALRTTDPVTFYRIRHLGGDPGESLLVEVVEQLLADNDLSRLRALGEVAGEEGRWEEFTSLVRERLPAHLAEMVLARRSSPRGGRSS